MVVLKQLLKCTNVLSLYLQSKQIDLHRSCHHILECYTFCFKKKKRTDSVFHRCFETASSLAGVDIPIVLSTRRKRVSQWLDHMWQNEHQHETRESKYGVEFYFQVLDCMIEQIEQWFSQETQTLLVSFSYLQPEKVLKREMSKNIKPPKTPSWNLWNGCVNFENWILLLRESRRDILQNCKIVLDVLQVIRQTGLHMVYPWTLPALPFVCYTFW